MINLDRAVNRYPANCSECKTYVEKGLGFLFRNTKYRTSKGFHVKCLECYTGITAKRIRDKEKEEKGKTLSLPFAKKWVEQLKIAVKNDGYGDYCEVFDGDVLILGWVNFMEGFQEYPNDDWCAEQAKRLSGTFTDKAVEYICEVLTKKIESI